MKQSTFIIVGDDYKNFALQDDVFTISSFFEKVNQQKDWLSKDHNILMGQGISYQDREYLDSFLESRGVRNTHSLAPTASLSDTHKRSDENVLVSDPQRLGKLDYMFDLNLTDKVDRLSDHVTGKHVGAMLLMEAARQATIVALEYEYCKESEQKLSLILDRFNSKFDGYLFPLPATLHTTIEELKITDKTITVVVNTNVSQSGASIGDISLNVTLFNSEVLDKIEERKSQTAVQELLKIMTQSEEKELSIA
jgi:hypothetical protein